MKKPIYALLALFACAVLPLYAADLSDLTWTTTNGEVTITDCDQAASGELVIPDAIGGNPVTSIEAFAFEDCASLTSIIIPDSVTSIGSYTFDGCSSLKSITIPDSVTSIETGAFYNCSSLTSITIPDSVTSIWTGAFENCTSLTTITIPDSVASIRGDAFENCTSLTTITIPDSVTSIGLGCFTGSPITNLEIPSRFSLALTYLGISPELSYQKLMEFTTSNEVETAVITTEINQIKEQLAGAGGISPEQAAAITSNTEGVNEVKNAIFIGGSSIIPALLSNDQEQRDSITANTTKIEGIISDVTTQFETLGNNDTAIGEQLTTLGQNDISIAEQMTTLGENDQSISEQMSTLSENDQSIMAEINAMKAQLQTLVASVAEKDKRIAELEQGGGGQSLEQVLEQVRDARAGSVVLTVDPEGDTVTLGLTIEQSDNLIEWTKLDGEMTRTIPIPDGKKFYRFALDK
jgi:hypothetical protein